MYSWLQVHLSRFTTNGALVSQDSNVVNSHRWSHWFPVQMAVAGRVTALNSNYMVAVRAAIAACETLTAVVCILTIFTISSWCCKITMKELLEVINS